jgi:hypothetical protein
MNRCEQCNVDVGEGRQLWGEHVKGKKHQRKLKLSAEEKNGDKSKAEPDLADNRTCKQRKRDRKRRNLDKKVEAQKIQDQQGLLIVADLEGGFQK